MWVALNVIFSAFQSQVQGYTHTHINIYCIGPVPSRYLLLLSFLYNCLCRLFCWSASIGCDQCYRINRMCLDVRCSVKLTFAIAFMHFRRHRINSSYMATQPFFIYQICRFELKLGEKLIFSFARYFCSPLHTFVC